MPMPAAAAAMVTSRTNPSCSSTPARPYCAHRSDGRRLPSGPTRRNSISWPNNASMSAAGSRSSMRRSVPRLQAGTGAPSWSKNEPGAQARPSPSVFSAVRSIRMRSSPTTPRSFVNAMPVWSIANTCQTGLAPRPGSANAVNRRSGTVLACVRPAGLTTVPTTVSIPLASSSAIDGADARSSVISNIVQGSEPARGVWGQLFVRRRGVSLGRQDAEHSVGGPRPGELLGATACTSTAPSQWSADDLHHRARDRAGVVRGVRAAVGGDDLPQRRAAGHDGGRAGCERLQRCQPEGFVRAGRQGHIGRSQQRGNLGAAVHEPGETRPATARRDARAYAAAALRR